MCKLMVKKSSDISLLSHMYLELLEDEQADFKLSIQQAAKKMAAFLQDGEIAFIFSANGQVVGYALIIPNRQPVYLHHFYICRNARRHGFGTSAFDLIMQTLDIKTIDLDVFVWNTRGNTFWKSLGFEPRATIMRYKGEEKPQ